MKANKIIMLSVMMIFIVITFVMPTLAINQNYESATTARIVGDSPADLMKQLQNNGKIELEKSIYVGKQGGSLQEYTDASIYEILIKMFKDLKYLIYTGYDNLNSELDVVKDVLLIINPYFNDYSMDKISFLSSNEAKQLSINLEKNDNLIILNTPYSGLYLPYENSLVGAISPSASMVAPMSYSSEMFLKAFLCNLASAGDRKNIGEIFKQARNNYYWHTNDKDELIGLTLLSYTLYGLPTRKVSVPRVDINSDINKFCEGYNYLYGEAPLPGSIISAKELNINAKSGRMQVFSSGSNIYEKSFEFNIPSYDIVDYENYSLIELEGSVNSLELFELVLPIRFSVQKFPLKTIITNFSITELSNPIDLILPNLPSFDGFNYVDRVCYKDQQEANIEFSRSYTEDSIMLIAKIRPVEILNCTEGKFRIYKTIKYKVEYIPYSPISIKKILNPNLVLPEQEFNISVELENIQTLPINGYLTIKDSKKDIINAKEVNVMDKGEYEISMKAPTEEGFYTYRIDFYYNNESVTYKEFSFIVTTLEISLIVPEIATSKADVNVLIFNNLNNSIQTNLEYYLLHNNKVEKSGSEEVIVKSGINTFTLNFEELERNKVVYNVIVGVPYLTKYKFATAPIITEHVPVVIQNNIIIKENETFNLSPEVYDVDGDPIKIDIKYPFDYNLSWRASFESSGDYEINITVDDGIKQVKKTILLTIENTNRHPVIETIGKIFLKEGENITISPVYWDPDNNNSVDNDDNNLTISYSGLINEDGLLSADFDDSGSYTIYISVFDGELSTSEKIEVEIQNVNRPPFLINNQITIYENEILNISELVKDLDNENSVTNDDNTLTISCDRLCDENGIWKTDFDDSGNYTINIEYSDGEFKKNETLFIQVINVNRAPILISSSNQKKYYISENSLLELNVSASDPDGDSVKIEWYVDEKKQGEGENFIFDPKGQIKTFDVKVVANDGDLVNSEIFSVIVSDVPILEVFDGLTSRVDKASLESFYPFILEKSGKGKIVFKQPVNLSEMVDFVNTVIIKKAYISLNSEKLNALANISARVHLYDIDFEENKTPIIYYDEEFNANELGMKVCPSSICNTINYKDNMLEFDVSHFSTFFIKQIQGEQIGFYAPENITLVLKPNSDYIEENFEIKNLGLADLDNLIINRSFYVPNSLQVLPTQIYLPSGNSEFIKIKGSIELGEFSLIRIGEIIFENDGLRYITSVYAEKQKPLVIDDLDIEIGDLVYRNVQNGDYIIIEPNKDLEIKLKIKNLLENKKIENVAIEVLIKDINLGSDFREKLHKFDLKAKEVTSKEIIFKLPEVLEENEYTLEIRISGEIEDHKNYETNWKVILDTNKKSHEIVFRNVRLEPSKIKCGEEKDTKLYVDIINQGLNNEENLRLVIENELLGIYIEKEFDISANEKKSYSYPIELKKDINSGSYDLKMKLYTKGGRVLDEIEKNFEIDTCMNTKILSLSGNSIKLNNPNIYKKSEFDIEKLFILCFVIFDAILVIIVIYLALKLEKNDSYKNHKL